MSSKVTPLPQCLPKKHKDFFKSMLDANKGYPIPQLLEADRIELELQDLEAESNQIADYTKLNELMARWFAAGKITQELVDLVASQNWPRYRNARLTIDGNPDLSIESIKAKKQHDIKEDIKSGILDALFYKPITAEMLDVMFGSKVVYIRTGKLLQVLSAKATIPDVNRLMKFLLSDIIFEFSVTGESSLFNLKGQFWKGNHLHNPTEVTWNNDLLEELVDENLAGNVLDLAATAYATVAQLDTQVHADASADWLVETIERKILIIIKDDIKRGEWNDLLADKLTYTEYLNNLRGVDVFNIPGQAARKLGQATGTVAGYAGELGAEALLGTAQGLGIYPIAFLFLASYIYVSYFSTLARVLSPVGQITGILPSRNNNFRRVAMRNPNTGEVKVKVMRGPAGPAGVPGRPGRIGPKGSKGLLGRPGARGGKGIAGKKGDRGSEGRVGLAGSQGVSGRPGARGLRGSSRNIVQRVVEELVDDEDPWVPDDYNSDDDADFDPELIEYDLDGFNDLAGDSDLDDY